MSEQNQAPKMSREEVESQKPQVEGQEGQAQQPKKGMSTGCIVLIVLAALSVPVIGIMAAVAIPAFLKFERKSKTSEAAINLKAMSDGAVYWYDAEHADKQGNPIEKQFPCTGKGWICTPSAKPCTGGNPLYTASPARWAGNTCWQHLKFAIVKAHRYRYCYKAVGTKTAATFTVKAHADLDCDGTLSTYMIMGNVNKNTGEVERSNLIITDALE